MWKPISDREPPEEDCCFDFAMLRYRGLHEALMTPKVTKFGRSQIPSLIRFAMNTIFEGDSAGQPRKTRYSHTWFAHAKRLQKRHRNHFHHYPLNLKVVPPRKLDQIGSRFSRGAPRLRSSSLTAKAFINEPQCAPSETD